MIPRVIHQTWKTTDVPQRWASLRESWRIHNPDWDYRFWTDADNRQLVLDHFPSLLPVYDSYTLGINRADLARYLIMCHHGGLYVDLDFECLRPIEPALKGRELVFGLEPQTHAQRPDVRQRGLDKVVCNAFIASAPEHPFWNHLLPQLEAARALEEVLDATGPFLLTRAYESYGRRSEVTLLSADLLYPLDVEQARGLEPGEWRPFVENAFAVHRWNNTWGREAIFSIARRRIQKTREALFSSESSPATSVGISSTGPPTRSA